MIRKLIVWAVILVVPSSLFAQTATKPKMLGFSESQEKVLLEANRVTNAAEMCDYKISQDDMESRLKDEKLSMGEMEIRSVSPELKTEIQDDRKSYSKDKTSACAKAISDFGPSGTVGHFLTK